MKCGTTLVFIALLAIANAQTESRDTSVTASAESGGVEFDHQSVETEFTSATATAQVTTSEDADERKPSPSVSATATASTSASTVVEMPTPPPFPVDFSTTESSLRTAIFQGDVDTAAKVLGSSRVVSLGAGLTYPAELAFLVQPSRDRNQDPDVVAFKALAQSAFDTDESTKLATAVVFSFQPDCQCSALSADEADNIREAFAKDFEDRSELVQILNADANRDFETIGRRLSQAGKSPVNSFVCAYCWPKRQCRKMHWC